jgi:hypothetical protein
MLNRFTQVVLLSVLCVNAGESQSLDEYKVKAAYLFSFAKFVEWPATAFKGSGDPVAICILGQNPFGQMLEEIVKDKCVDGRAFTVTRLADVKQAGNCQIIFISSSQQRHFRSILESLETSGALTVGDVEGFAAAGGVANFQLESGKIRIEINVEAAARKKLRISSRLLSLAQIVK